MKFDDPAKNFAPRNEEEHEFYKLVLNSICAKLGKDPDNFHDVPLNMAMLSQFTSDWLWDSLWLGKDHENFKRVAMNKSFPTTQAFIQSVQQQVQAVVDSNISYNMKVRETLRLSSITLLNDTAATLIRLKIHVVSDSTL